MGAVPRPSCLSSLMLKEVGVLMASSKEGHLTRLKPGHQAQLRGRGMLFHESPVSRIPSRDRSWACKLAGHCARRANEDTCLSSQTVF